MPKLSKARFEHILEGNGEVYYCARVVKPKNKANFGKYFTNHFGALATNIKILDIRRLGAHLSSATTKTMTVIITENKLWEDVKDDFPNAYVFGKSVFKEVLASGQELNWNGQSIKSLQLNGESIHITGNGNKEVERWILGANGRISISAIEAKLIVFPKLSDVVDCISSNSPERVEWLDVLKAVSKGALIKGLEWVQNLSNGLLKDPVLEFSMQHKFLHSAFIYIPQSVEQSSADDMKKSINECGGKVISKLDPSMHQIVIFNDTIDRALALADFSEMELQQIRSDIRFHPLNLTYLQRCLTAKSVSDFTNAVFQLPQSTQPLHQLYEFDIPRKVVLYLDPLLSESDVQTVKTTLGDAMPKITRHRKRATDTICYYYTTLVPNERTRTLACIRRWNRKGSPHDNCFSWEIPVQIKSTQLQLFHGMTVNILFNLSTYKHQKEALQLSGIFTRLGGKIVKEFPKDQKNCTYLWQRGCADEFVKKLLKRRSNHPSIYHSTFILDALKLGLDAARAKNLVTEESLEGSIVTENKELTRKKRKLKANEKTEGEDDVVEVPKRARKTNFVSTTTTASNLNAQKPTGSNTTLGFSKATFAHAKSMSTMKTDNKAKKLKSRIQSKNSEDGINKASTSILETRLSTYRRRPLRIPQATTTNRITASTSSNLPDTSKETRTVPKPLPELAKDANKAVTAQNETEKPVHCEEDSVNKESDLQTSLPGHGKLNLISNFKPYSLVINLSQNFSENENSEEEEEENSVLGTADETESISSETTFISSTSTTESSTSVTPPRAIVEPADKTDTILDKVESTSNLNLAVAKYVPPTFEQPPDLELVCAGFLPFTLTENSGNRNKVSLNGAAVYEGLKTEMLSLAGGLGLELQQPLHQTCFPPYYPSYQSGIAFISAMHDVNNPNLMTGIFNRDDTNVFSDTNVVSRLHRFLALCGFKAVIVLHGNVKQFVISCGDNANVVAAALSDSPDGSGRFCIFNLLMLSLSQLQTLRSKFMFPRCILICDNKDKECPVCGMLTLLNEQAPQRLSGQLTEDILKRAAAVFVCSVQSSNVNKSRTLRVSATAGEDFQEILNSEIEEYDLASFLRTRDANIPLNRINFGIVCQDCRQTTTADFISGQVDQLDESIPNACSVNEVCNGNSSGPFYVISKRI